MMNRRSNPAEVEQQEGYVDGQKCIQCGNIQIGFWFIVLP
jgi:hypothetical protein